MNLSVVSGDVNSLAKSRRGSLLGTPTEQSCNASLGVGGVGQLEVAWMKVEG